MNSLISKRIDFICSRLHNSMIHRSARKFNSTKWDYNHGITYRNQAQLYTKYVDSFEKKALAEAVNFFLSLDFESESEIREYWNKVKEKITTLSMSTYASVEATIFSRGARVGTSVGPHHRLFENSRISSSHQISSVVEENFNLGIIEFQKKQSRLEAEAQRKQKEIDDRRTQERAHVSQSIGVAVLFVIGVMLLKEFHLAAGTLASCSALQYFLVQRMPRTSNVLYWMSWIAFIYLAYRLVGFPSVFPYAVLLFNG